MSEVFTELPDFNLIYEPWIPVKMLDGTIQELSLINLYKKSLEIQRIDSGEALVDVSLLGLVTVIFARAIYYDDTILNSIYDDTYQWIQDVRLGKESFSHAVNNYLLDFEDRFNLFNSDRPFMQVADLKSASKEPFKSVSVLLPYDSKKDYFSIRALEINKELGYAEAARYLVTAHAYDTAGNKTGSLGHPRTKQGKIPSKLVGWSGAVGKIIVHGKNLLETLTYNIDYSQLLKTIDDEYVFEDDKPVWELLEKDLAAPRVYSTGYSGSPKDEPVYPSSGMCAMLCWQGRRIRLIPQKGKVIGCIISAGDLYERENNFTDPWVSYILVNKSKRNKVLIPSKHSLERTFWRGVSALLTQKGISAGGSVKIAENIRQISSGKYFPTDAKVKVQLVGVVYGTQSSVIEDIINEYVTLELELLTEQGVEVSVAVCDSIQVTMDAAKVLGEYAGELLRAAGKNKGHECISVTESVLYRMEDEFRSWLADLSVSDDASAQAAKWQSKVRRILEREADQLAVSAGPKAAIGTIYDEQLYTTAKARRQFGGRLYKILNLAYSSTPTEKKEEGNE